MVGDCSGANNVVEIVGKLEAEVRVVVVAAREVALGARLVGVLAELLVEVAVVVEWAF